MWPPVIPLVVADRIRLPVVTATMIMARLVGGDRRHCRSTECTADDGAAAAAQLIANQCPEAATERAAKRRIQALVLGNRGRAREAQHRQGRR